MAYAYRHKPTIVPYPDFNAAEDGQALRAAMKGIGTDEQAIIDILTKRSNSQRQQIAQFFTEEYGRNLIDDLKSELGGKFEKVTIALMLPPLEYLTRQLHKAMKGAGTDEGAVIEILCTRNKTELQKMVDMYETLFDRPLAEHVCSETSGDFRRFLTLLVTGVRDPPGTKNPGKAREEAEKLFQAGEGKLGTDEEVFNKILSHDSYEQLQLVFSEYKAVAGRTIEQGLKSEVSGPLLEAYLAVVEYVQNPVTYFARRLHKAMEGFGSDDTTLIRIIVNHSEDDLQNIKEEYEKLYDRTLESDIKSETSGDYKKALLAILGSP